MIKINGIDVLTTIEEFVDPAYSAIMVVDMQNEMCHENGGYAKHGTDISGWRAIIPKISRLLEVGRKMGIQVAYAEFLHKSQTGKMLINAQQYTMHRAPPKWISTVVEGTWESRTVDELAPQKGDIVVRKSRGGAFYHTYLDDQLKEKSIRSLILTGIACGGCVFATAVSSYEYGYYPIIVRDCVNQNEPEALRFMEGRFPMYQSDEVIAVWNKMKESQKR